MSANTLVTPPIVSFQTYPYFPFVMWPNGKPCFHINAYILSKRGKTGATHKSYATKLVHLVRYCFQENISFEQFSDSYMEAFVKQLLNEKREKEPTIPARARRRVREIIAQTIDFFFWLQENRLFKYMHIPLIGPISTTPQITVTQKSAAVTGLNRKNVVYWEHHAMPTASSLNEKRPITKASIEAIENAIYEFSQLENQSEYTLRREKDVVHFKAKLKYLRERRAFMIWLFWRVGLRPSEAELMNESDHGMIIKEKVLLLTTAKRRKLDRPVRRFPIDVKDAVRVTRYLAQRNRYLIHLTDTGRLSQSNGAMFLTEKGGPLSKESMTRDFSRLVHRAGLGDVRTCLSMFRHRWITMMVLVHLKEFMKATGSTRSTATTDDYRMILRKVADLTGHKNPDSLWAYIDLAWKEHGVWDSANDSLEMQRRLDQHNSELLDIRTIMSNPDIEAEEKVRLAQERLLELTVGGIFQ